MKLLALETATEACSAALLVDQTVQMRHEIAPRRHTELILPMCQSLLEEAGLVLAQLDAIVFGRGPGSFTGVRIAAGVAQGLALAHDLPVVPISTLAALAQTAVADAQGCDIIAALDARMQEVYVGFFKLDEISLAYTIGNEHVYRPAQVTLPYKGAWFGVGPGFASYPLLQWVGLNTPLKGVNESRLPHAQAVAWLGARAFTQGEVVAPDQAMPVYLRDTVAQIPR